MLERSGAGALSASPSELGRALQNRKVGIELEFASLPVLRAADVVRRRFPGDFAHEATHDVELAVERLGDFKITLDTRHVQKIEGEPEIVSKAREWFGDLASVVIPVEVATPPLGADRIAEVDGLVGDLRRAGAQGTRRSLLYAFGAHLNVEWRGGEVSDVLPVLQAYLLLEDAIRAEIKVDPSRSAAGFESPFPSAYRNLALDPAYAPTQAQMIDDYLAHNRTRNRGLDMLPLLAFWDEDRVAASLADEKVGARPAFHYRLPNCEIDDPSWSVALELTRWMAVDALASNRSELKRALDRRAGVMRRSVFWPFTSRAATHASQLWSRLRRRGVRSAFEGASA